jgi:hypothetical protein
MRDNALPKRALTPREVRLLQKTLNEDYRVIDLRLRQGEYQYELAKGIAAFQRELHFPNVKDIIRELYGEEKADDVQFIRKIQTILKKMEKRKVIEILPKKKPWELQRYAISSYKFQDIDRNQVNFASEQQILQTQNLLASLISQQETTSKQSMIKAKIFMLMLLVAVSYSAGAWTLIQPFINPIVFVLTYSFAVICSLILGKTLAQE